MESLGRKHLANVRVVQRNVVYVVGIGPRFAKEEVSGALIFIGCMRVSQPITVQLIPTLRSHEFFGQYGKISKIVIVKRSSSGGVCEAGHVVGEKERYSAVWSDEERRVGLKAL